MAHWGAAAVCALAGAAVFQFFGNANHGYINTDSLFWWWIFQWLNPASEAEHGWLILAIAGWLLYRNLNGRSQEPGGRSQEMKQIADGGMRSAEWRKSEAAVVPARSSARGLSNPQSAIRNPQSTNRNSKIETRKSAAAFAALIAGLALHAVGFAAQEARVSIIALLVFAWGVLRLGGGRRWGASAVFPLGFLVFAIPMTVLDSAGFWLRMWVIEASAGLAHAAGIDVIRNGTQLVAPDGRYNYDVAAACSGVRSLMALAALSLLVGYLSFRSFWRRAAVFLLCFPLVYVGNVARITAIVFAAQRGGTRWGDRAHEVMGWGIFVIVLGGVLAAVKLLERWVPEAGSVREPGHGGQLAIADGGTRNAELQTSDQADVRPTTHPPSAIRTRQSKPMWVAITVVLLVGAEAFLLHHLAMLPPRGGAGVVLTADGKSPAELPTFLGHEWVGSPVPVSAVEREILPADTGFSRADYAGTHDGHHVFLSIVLSGRDRTSIHRPELCLVGQGWTIVDRGAHDFAYPGAGAFPTTLLHVSRRIPGYGAGAVPQLVAYWFVNADTIVATHWQRLARDAWNRVARARADRWAYVLVQTDATDGEPAALTRMQAVLNGALPAFQRVGGLGVLKSR
jgi:EpsI family protein